MVIKKSSKIQASNAKKVVVKKAAAKKIKTVKAPKRPRINKKNTIYIQIASYRDPELLNTIKDCLDNAKYPENLRFAIGWQHSAYESWDNLDPYINDDRFNILDIDYRDAKGPCWIRAQLNAAYNGEKYTLQLDSHHRFAPDWDTTVIEMLENLRSPEVPKPLLSSYLPSFDPQNDPAGRVNEPWIMEFDRFAPEGPVHFQPHTMDDFRERTSPVPHRFCSGHFIFADGSFCKDVPYDPEYYFHGEEINLGVRSFMAGYDIFAPHRVFMWHEYTREGKKKHWDDHTDWAELDKNSHKHNRELFGIDASKAKIKKNKRSLLEYELFAGLEFKTRRSHKDTIAKKLPPISLDSTSHKDGLVSFHRMCIDIHKPHFKEKDYETFAVAFEDATGKEIYRQDANEPEITSMLAVPMERDAFIHIWRNFYAETIPTKWVVWPHSKSKGWIERVEGVFNTGDVQV